MKKMKALVNIITYMNPHVDNEVFLFSACDYKYVDDHAMKKRCNFLHDNRSKEEGKNRTTKGERAV